MWNLTYTPEVTSPAVMAAPDKVKVAILREEGSNGDREMAAAIHSAGMQPWVGTRQCCSPCHHHLIHHKVYRCSPSIHYSA